MFGTIIFIIKYTSSTQSMCQETNYSHLCLTKCQHNNGIYHDTETP